jgi:hypothetical protein
MRKTTSVAPQRTFLRLLNGDTPILLTSDSTLLAESYCKASSAMHDALFNFMTLDHQACVIYKQANLYCQFISSNHKSLNNTPINSRYGR